MIHSKILGGMIKSCNKLINANFVLPRFAFVEDNTFNSIPV